MNILEFIRGAAIAGSAYYPKKPYSGSLPSKTIKKGSNGNEVKNLQTFLNWCIGLKLAVDGNCGKNTVAAIKKWQRRYAKAYGIAIDGIFGPASIKAANKIVEKYAIKPDPLQPWYDAIKEQFEWSKHQEYKWVNPPTIENSRTRGTCISLPNVALQRLGLFEEGEWFYMNLKTGKINGNAADYVLGHPEIFTVIYPHMMIAELGSNIKRGDIIAFSGKRGHIMVYKGRNSKGNPIFDTIGHTRGLNITYPAYAKRKIDMIVRLKKVTK